MNLFHLWTRLAFWKYEVKSHSEHWNHKVFKKLFFFTHSPIASLVACVAWWFWLGAQSNKGRQGQRNCKEIGREQWETACLDGWPFWIVRMPLYRSSQLDQNVHPSIKYLVISDVRVPSDWKIFSAKQNQNIKELLTQTLTILNIQWENRAIVLKPEQEMVIYSLLHRRDVIKKWQFCQLVLARAWPLLSLLWLKKMSSSKTCMITILPPKKYIM